MERMVRQAPEKIPFYFSKFKYLVLRKDFQYMECPIAKSLGKRLVKADALHHAGIHNTGENRARFPLVVHSLINLLPVNNNFHLIRGSYGIKPDSWAEAWQRFLSKPAHWKCRIFLNTGEWPTNEEKKLAGKVV